MTVLVAEDDHNTRAGLMEILAAEGYTPLPAENGEEALSLFMKHNPDIVCLDIMMPRINGYDVCRKIRAGGSDVPVLFISAKSEEIDKVLGLELGADDYIVKPFGVKEVIARIRAVTRRYFARNPSGVEVEVFQMGDLKVAAQELRAYRGDEQIELSLRDVAVLRLLWKNRGKVVDRNALFDYVWGMDYLPNSRTLDQHISQLRKKIELDPKLPVIIKTVHNAGYRFE